MKALPPILYHHHTGHVYRIRVTPDGVEVERLATGTSPAAKSISFEAAPHLRSDKKWKSTVVEELIERYERQLAVVQDKDKPTP